MREDRYEELMERMSRLLDVNGDSPCVSPTSVSGGSGRLPDSLFIKKDMETEGLSRNGVILMHCLLHKFYATGSKGLTREDIEILHSKVSSKLNTHIAFDSLDRR